MSEPLSGYSEIQPESNNSDKERIIKYFKDILSVEYPEGEYKPESLALLKHAKYSLTVLVKELTENLDKI